MAIMCAIGDCVECQFCMLFTAVSTGYRCDVGFLPRERINNSLSRRHLDVRRDRYFSMYNEPVSYLVVARYRGCVVFSICGCGRGIGLQIQANKGEPADRLAIVCGSRDVDIYKF